MPVADAKSKGPDPIDVHLGKKIRRRRGQLGMSQEALAHALGLTFQQVQNYERGANRVAASRLWRLAEALDAPITFFFEGLAGGERPAPTPSRYESAVLRGLACIAKGDAQCVRCVRDVVGGDDPAAGRWSRGCQTRTAPVAPSRDPRRRAVRAYRRLTTLLDDFVIGCTLSRSRARPQWPFRLRHSRKARPASLFRHFSPARPM